MARRKKISKYLELFDQTLAELNQQGIRPKLLLQACCAPCSTSVLELLIPYFEITLFFNGHNIYPQSEYDKRHQEVKRFVDIANRDFNGDVTLVSIEPQMGDFMKKLAFGKDEREGGARCQFCYGVRMRETLDYAVKHHYDYVTTVMTISRQKCSEKINHVAELLMPQYPQITYVYSDFKKRNGNNRSIELCHAYDLYQQDYCGCVYSLKEKYERDKQREQTL